MSDVVLGGENCSPDDELGCWKAVDGEIHDAYLVFDGDGHVWEASLECCNLLGLRQDDILDNGLLKLLPPEDGKLLLKLIRSASGQVDGLNWAGVLCTGRGEMKLRLVLQPLGPDSAEGSWVKCRVKPFSNSGIHRSELPAQSEPGCSTGEGLRPSRSNRRHVDRRGNYDELVHLAQQQQSIISGLELDLQRRREVEDRLVARMAEVEEALAKRKQELKQVNMDLRDVGKLVHNAIGTPVRKLESATRAAMNHAADTLPAQVRAYLEATLELTIKEQKLLDQVTLFALVGSEPVTRAHVDMEALFAQVSRELVERTGDGSHPAIHVGKLAPCISDVRLLKVVVEQLLLNALRFSSKKNSVIDVSCYQERVQHGPRRAKQYVWVVRDNGVGFPACRAHRLFTPGVVLHERGALSGAGIGLAVARRAIERLGGKIWAEGQEGEGASFHFCIHSRVERQ